VAFALSRLSLHEDLASTILSLSLAHLSRHIAPLFRIPIPLSATLLQRKFRVQVGSFIILIGVAINQVLVVGQHTDKAEA
jgi:hypothetical protein